MKKASLITIYFYSKILRLFFLHILFINLLISFCFFPGIANAQSAQSTRILEPGPRNIEVGPVHVSPSLGLSVEYTDNVFAAPTNEKDDFIATFTPGIRLLLTPSKHILFFEYEGRFTKYAEFTSDETKNHKIEAIGEFNFTRGLSLRAWDSYVIGHEKRGESSTGLIESFTRNTIGTSASYEFRDDYKFTAEYSNSTYDFVLSPFRDRKEDAIVGIASYRFRPKLFALIEYDYKMIDFDTTPVASASLDSDSYGVLGGIQWDFTGKTTGIVKAGYFSKDFNAVGIKDYSSFIYSGNLEVKFTKFTAFDVTAGKSVNETALSGSSFFIANVFSGRLIHIFTRKTSAKLKASYEIDDFQTRLTIGAQTGTREDKIFRMGGGVEYRIQEWLHLDLEYTYTDKNSNFNVFDYEENSVVISARIVL